MQGCSAAMTLDLNSLLVAVGRVAFSRLVVILLGGVLLLPLAAVAQFCKSNNNGCVSEKAVCSPVFSGTGPTGLCTTSGPSRVRECNCVGAPAIDLTGRWLANDGSVYYLRQIGNELWWAGFSVESPQGVSDFHTGLQFTNVFHGQVSPGSVSGEWADVPRGRTFGTGTLTLSFTVNQILRQAATGGFGTAEWNRLSDAPPVPADPFSLFDSVYKNTNGFRDNTLLDNLKPVKTKPVAIFGNIAPNGTDCDPGKPCDPLIVNLLASRGRNYLDFMCLPDAEANDEDADIDFEIAIDRANLDAQIGFWEEGWYPSNPQFNFVTPSEFRAKLDLKHNKLPLNHLHIESIMYGGTLNCFDLLWTEEQTGTIPQPSFLLPGWQQAGAASALFDGVPIWGSMQLGPRDSPHQSRILSILGTSVPFGSRIRVTGILVLDCGHGWTHDCGEDDAGKQNQEIHPVYALDVVQNFQQPRPFANLTGVWSSDDAGTYYVRQLGSTVWWLGLSVDEGQTFANVFRGTLNNGQVSGNWADIPLGGTDNSGTLNVAGNSMSTALTRVGATGAFAGDKWEKLYDVVERNIILVVESAEINGSWPNTPGAFEFRVGTQEAEAQPGNPHPAPSSKGQQVTRVDLGTRIPVTFSRTAALPMAVRFAEYRAIWSISRSDLTPGEHVQTLMPVAADPGTGRPSERSEVKDRNGRDIEVRSRNATMPRLPALTLRYRIEEAGAAH